MSLLALVLLFAAPGLAAPDEQTPGRPAEAPTQAPLPVRGLAPQPESSPRQRLDDAVQLYLKGDLPGASVALVLLVSDPAIQDDALVQEARVWLGQVQYVMGDRQAAEDTFGAALLYDPALRLDPVQHPPEIVMFFDAVRASVEAAQRARPRPDLRPVAPTPVPRPPVWAWVVPGGLQFNNDQPLLGTLTLTGVSGLSVSALAIRLWLLEQDEMPDRWGIQLRNETAATRPDKDLRAQQLNTIRQVENGLGFAAVGLWGLGLTQGALRWQERQRATLQVTPGGVAVVVDW